MKVAVFSTKSYDRQFLDAANGGRHDLRYLEERLTPATANLAAGCAAVSLFANDQANVAAIEALSALGVKTIALRAAGFDNVDLKAASEHGISVSRVPAYSPHAVAEHTFALLLSLVRKVHRGYDRVLDGNFSLDGLLGFDLAGKTIGVVGTGNIGSVVAQIARGFGMTVLAADPVTNAACADYVDYVPLPDLLRRSDIITLHCPLNRDTRHLIDRRALAAMRAGSILINASRGAVVDTGAVVDSLKNGHLGGLAIDVYENEGALFFENRSEQPIMDDLFVRLRAFPKVLITGHQGFFTGEALKNIAETTIANLNAFGARGKPLHEVAPVEVAARADTAVRDSDAVERA